MPAKLEEIEGRFIRERYRFDECLIGSIRTPSHDLLTIKGDADLDELQPRQSYRFYGRFAEYKNKRTGKTERQFHFQTFVIAQAHDREGVINYLVHAGKGNGLGPATAARAYDQLGDRCVTIIRENPRELLALSRTIKEQQCEAIGAILEQQRKTEDATIELTNILTGRGFPKTTARKAIKKWGNKAADTIRKDPYALMNFRGCGFKLCDQLWIELGHRPDRLKRQALCAWYSVASNSDGHIWFPVDHVKQFVRQNIGSANAKPETAIQLAQRLAKLSPNHYGALAELRTADGCVSEYGDRRWIAEGKKANAEQSLASLVASAIAETDKREIAEYSQHHVTWKEAASAVQCSKCSRELASPKVHIWNGKPFCSACIQSISDGEGVETISLDDWVDMQPPLVQSALTEIPAGRIELPSFSIWPSPESIDGIDDHQREKLADALVSRIAILGGSPGTGKTYATAMLIKTLLQSGLVGPQDIAIGAPTGKAAVRITEAMHAAGVNLHARTWHSLLGVGKSDDENGGWSFQHNESNPWPFRIIIGDESSMLDTALMRSIFAARPKGAHVLLVGDVNQLPPVGAGAPLRDLIASECVGYGELTEIKRNSGGIVEACAAIRDGKRWEPGDNLHVLQPGGPESQLETTLQVLAKAKAKGFDPVWDCQVLVAVNAKSKLSRKIVNQRLQSELNPNDDGLRKSPFRFDDKIVCTKNGYFNTTGLDQDEVYVANGELARVAWVEDGFFIAELSNPDRIIRIPRGKSKGDDGEESNGCNWDLAYGLSCHKSQGSEWPVVIVLVDDYAGAQRVCDRSWIYTAISRAKAKCFLIGRKTTADSMCRRMTIHKRKTHLRELIQLQSSKSVMESLV